MHVYMNDGISSEICSVNAISAQTAPPFAVSTLTAVTEHIDDSPAMYFSCVSALAISSF